MIAGVFSGQGSQKAGMGQDLCQASPAARLVYAEAADRLGLDLLQLDDSQLAQTRYAQLAIVTLSLAAWQAFRTVGQLGQPLAYAGFSLGEYSALGAAGILSFADLLALVNERSRLMQEAAEADPGAMFAILGLDDDTLRGLVGQPQFAGQVYAVNFNCPGQIVIAGRADPASACAEALKTAGAKRAVRLSVNGAFHTPLMAAAARQLADFARQLTFRPPEGPFYSNTTALLVDSSVNWPDYLAAHMCSPVQWTAEVTAMQHNGCSAYLEFGPGKVLTGLIKKILPGSTVFAVEDSRTLADACSGIVG